MSLSYFHISNPTNGRHFSVWAMDLELAYAAARLVDGQETPRGPMVEYGEDVPAPADATIVLVSELSEINVAMDAVRDAANAPATQARALGSRMVVWAEPLLEQADYVCDAAERACQ